MLGKLSKSYAKERDAESRSVAYVRSPIRHNVAWNPHGFRNVSSKPISTPVDTQCMQWT